MTNGYETAEVLELGRAQDVILGMKVQDPVGWDDPFGVGWRFIENEIDETDE